MQTVREAELGPAGERLIRLAQISTVRIHPEHGDDLLVVAETAYADLQFTLETTARLVRARGARQADGGLPDGWTDPVWPWLKELPTEDLDTFFGEVEAAIVDAATTGPAEGLRHLLHEWQLTAEAWSDPLTRDVWSEPFRFEDFVEVSQPE